MTTINSAFPLTKPKVLESNEYDTASEGFSLLSAQSKVKVSADVRLRLTDCATQHGEYKSTGN